MRRFFAPFLLVAALVAGCSAETEPPSNVTATSADLEAKGVCDAGQDGQARFLYRPVSGGTDTATPWSEQFTCPASGTYNDSVTGLAPDTLYEYRVQWRQASNGAVYTFDKDGHVNDQAIHPETFRTAVAETPPPPPPPPIGDPIVFGEDQGWQTGASNPQPHDQHLHLAVVQNLRPFDRLTSARDVVVRITTHNNATPVDYVRWSCESTIKQRVDLNWSAEGTATKDVVLRVDPAQCSEGVREIRFTANRGTGQREFTTSRFPVLFDRDNNGGGSHYGTTPASVQATSFTPSNAGRCGGGAWYEADDYQIIFLDCRDYHRMLYGTFAPGDIVRVKSQDGQGVAVLDPNFHSGNNGRELARFPANTYTNVRIPTDVAPGTHTLHVRSISPAQPIEAGVHAVKFRVA